MVPDGRVVSFKVQKHEVSDALSTEYILHVFRILCGVI
jgi:hypothetical protein